MADKKEFTIKINGVEQETQSLGKLSDSLEKVSAKTKDVSVSSKDMLDSYSSEFQNVLGTLVVQISKVGATITELNSLVQQSAEKSIKSEEKLVEKIESSAEKGLSSVKIKGIEASALFESYMTKILGTSESMSERQSALLANQLEKNKQLLEEHSETEKKYAEKDKEIGLFNLKAHKENIKERIDGLNNFKSNLEEAIVKTRHYYNVMSVHYKQDSAEFKKNEEDKTKAIEDFQKKIEETNDLLKKQASSYLGVWKKQHKEISDKLNETTGNLSTIIPSKIKKGADEISKILTQYDETKEIVDQEFKKIDEADKKRIEEKYDAKIAKLDKERNKLREDITKAEKEKEQLEKDKTTADEKGKKYREDIKKIKETFEIKDTEKEEQTPDATEKSTLKSTSTTDEVSDEAINETSEENKDEINSAKEAEMQAAKDRIAELESLAEAEEKIVADKKNAIEEANKKISESNQSVLLDDMRMANEKTKLEEEKKKKLADIDAREQKRKEIIEKVEKIKKKIQLGKDIVEATSNIAKGVATAWAKGPIIGPPLAALVAIRGAMQIGIMTKQLAKFEDGGLLKGKRHTHGGMRIEGSNIEVEGGEYVVNRESTSKNLGLVRYINAERRALKPADLESFFSRSSRGFEPPYSRMMENGGQLPVAEPSANIDNEILVQAIRSIRIEPRVAVTDIQKVQGDMVSVDSWTGV